MRLHLVAIGQRVPAWVRDGYADYARRMPRECQLELHVLNPGRGGRKTAASVLRAQESRALMDRVPPGAGVVALDERGVAWSTQQLADRLSHWLGSGRDMALLVGGANGLDDTCRAVAEHIWSLSALTLPHAMVRIVVAEQLYRAWTLLKGHPYHRQ
ncbi:MAG: 23S rRNA (pseudouridine(1915)-N(3))-methyltransferase RlmH [Gammaproteobacteria bacterium]|nr:23S rRNA (pseudouridine(1915)-N(3))-methyltransferase RlmH [Gammaproteobacteria bacterium]